MKRSSPAGNTGIHERAPDGLLPRIPAKARAALCAATLLLFPLVLHCRADHPAQTDYAALREKMVVEQIEARGIRNPKVLRAMRTVERHLFVPEPLRHLAYNDHPLPIGEGQTISHPYIVALMTEAIKPHTEMRVLEIGTGSGYQAAVLAELCKSVYTIEIVETLGRRAQKLLSGRYKNVYVKTGDGYQGWPGASPFDAVVVTCAPEKVPEPLAAQLREGGRMIIPVGEAGEQELILLIKKNGRLERLGSIPVGFVPMVDGRGKKY